MKSLALGALRGRESSIGTLLVHLRLPFQGLLAPVFLWGWLASGGGWSADVLVGFVAFHVFLYGGATAFNSYYDCDTGPVGGLERPPPVMPALLPFALAMKALGWLLAVLVNGSFWLVYGAYLLLSVAYSHPRVRLKRDPVASLLAVGVGQGALAFLAGWAAARGEVASAASATGLIGATAATLMLLGLYPVSQVYQVEEDRARGDRTIAVAWGPVASLQLALLGQMLGGVALVATLGWLFGALDAVTVGLGLVGQLTLVALWARHFEPGDVLGNYRRAMRLSILSGLSLTGYFGLRLLVG